MPSNSIILATAGYDHTIKFWSAPTGQCTKTIHKNVNPSYNSTLHFTGVSRTNNSISFAVLGV